MLELLIMMRYTLKYRSNTTIGILLLLGLVLAPPAFAQFTGDSWSDFPGGAKAVCHNSTEDNSMDNDIDNDDDGLIELCYLEDVNAIRHQLDGSGYRSTASATLLTTGCGNNKCNGYELVRDLDFNEDDSYRATENKDTWTTGRGWPVIGDIDDGLTGILEGNGHSISNLFMKKRTEKVGLLLENTGSIRNLGLLNVNIEEARNDGDGYGVLIGDANNGTVVNCYVQGKIEYRGSGLLKAGAITKNNGTSGKISNTYTNMLYTKGFPLYYIVFQNYGTISDSYVNAIVSEGSQSVSRYGIGFNYGSITNIYITSNDISHMVNIANSSISNSYVDESLTSKYISAANGGVGGTPNVRSFSTEVLQSATGPGTSGTEPYYEWSTMNWVFTPADQYPALKHAIGDDMNNPACSTSQQPKCGSLLRGQRNAQPKITSPTNNTQIRALQGEEKTIPVIVSDTDIDDKLTVLLSPMDDKLGESVATYTVVRSNGKIEREGVLKIRIPETAKIGTTAQLKIIATDNSGFTNASSDEVLLNVIVGEDEANTTPTITISPSTEQTMQLGSMTDIVVLVEDGNFDVGDLVIVSAESSTPSVVKVTPEQIEEIKDNMEQRFVIRGVVAGESRITFTATDSKLASTSASVLVRVNTPPKVKNNVPAQVVATIGETFTLKTSEFFNDADGDTLTYRIIPNSLILKSLATRLTNGFSSTGTLTFTPIRTEASTSAAGQTVTVSVDDGRGSSATATFTLLINAEPELNDGVSVEVSGNIEGNTCDKWLLCAKSTVTDANGIADTTYQWYRDNELITGEATYTIPDTREGRAGGTVYRVDVTFVDNIGQSVTLQSANQHTVDNEKPVIARFNASTMAVDEGSPMENIRVNASDANRDSLKYTWRVKSGATEVLTSTNTNPARLSFPTDLVDATTDTTTLILEVTVSDSRLSTTGTVPVVVNKVNNGQITEGMISRNSSDTKILILSNIGGRDDPDSKVEVNVSYQWQRCWGSDDGVNCSKGSDAWTDIAGETGDSYEVPTTPIEGHAVQSEDRFRVELRYTDGQNYPEAVPSSNTLGPDPSSDIRIRSKVFLEGPLQ